MGRRDGRGRRGDRRGGRPDRASWQRHTEQDALAALHSADPVFFADSAGLGQSGAQVETERAAYALVTLSPTLTVACAEACTPPPALPSASRYQRRPAWIVMYRTTTGVVHGCSQPTRSSQSRSLPPAAQRWMVFIYPDRLDGALLYTEAGLGPCGNASAPALSLAWQHVGVAWRLLSRKGMTVTIAFTPPPCGRPSFSAAGSDDRTHGNISIIYAVPFGATNCPPSVQQTFRNSDFWPTVTHIGHGTVGVLGWPLSAS